MRHILFTLQGCAFDPLNDRSYIEVILKETAEICKSTLLDISSHKFQPQGVTAVALPQRVTLAFIPARKRYGSL